MKTLKTIKRIQCFFYLSGVAFLIFSIVLAQIGIIKPIHFFYRDLFCNLLSRNINYQWSINDISLYIIIPMFFLLVFFGIALYLGLKLFPIPLTAEEKIWVIASPYVAYSEIILSKILFGSVIPPPNNKSDFRGVKLYSVADLYLFHFRHSNKFNIFIFGFFIAIVFPFLIDTENRSLPIVLIINFFYIHILLMILLDSVLFLYANYIRNKNYVWN